MSISALNSYLPKLCAQPRATRTKAFAQPPTLAILSDPHVLRLAETFEDSIASAASSSSPAPPLQKLRDISSQSLLTTPWPSRKDEPFRFTDTSFIKNSEVQPVTLAPTPSLDTLSGLADSLFPSIAIIDGYLVDALSNLSELPEGVFVGRLSNLNSEVLMEKVAKYVSNFKGDLFWSLNGVGAPDLIIVYVPEGCKVENPLHLRFISMNWSEKGSKTLPVSNPRVLVLVEKGGEISLVEEYVGGDGDASCYWTNSVMEVVVGDGAKVSHSYIQTQSLGAAHVKWTSVRQESTSVYELTEVSTGGKLSRHNVHVQQEGPDTVTELSTFHLSIGDQLQDLHSKLVLDHPRGFSRQLHKVIVAHSLGQAVFDGNVQVNRYAQQTDAGQLTRSLLLEPRATVNVKPNLQIIADDVKCSHGAAISDLEEDQLFYFQARGIDKAAARKSLIFSFAAEVVEKFPFVTLQKKVENLIRTLLDPKLPSSEEDFSSYWFCTSCKSGSEHGGITKENSNVPFD
ncbi:non-intrinsic ABC protein 6 [Perilla frutescens var. hirtella]|uniref:Non-intrinsic ABC protein 6 n=1 Tax=Perilla frutescens var. hirtella TaxID=608512 RepID=A0AAD4P9L9_PERFH|nr:non-intrinsic ABC protein 6 [Perilla frutescens var. hirtella]